MRRAKTSLICTVFNEENTIEKFIDSIAKQSVMPSEVIIVDGDSKDNTASKINEKISEYKTQLLIKLYIKQGNRSVGRNYAIKKSSGDIILSSDSGNVLDKNWVKNITEQFKFKSVDVVAGYYKGEGKSLFQKTLIPYVLVMPDKVDEKEFLPATRSMAFTKKIWKKLGGFDEKLSHNEDYAFATRLKKLGANIVFRKDALVTWVPRANIYQAFKMFFRFALGDVESGIIRDKVLFLFLRYFLFFYFIFLSVVYKSEALISFIILGIIFYFFWSVKKQYKYVNLIKSIFLFPLIQLTADSAVMIGSIGGLIKIILGFKYLNWVKSNKILTTLVLSYTIVVLSTINWGIPNFNHPFAYGMDEWHSLQSLKSVITHGTDSIEGAANGPIFFYFLTGLYLIPFIILGIINPQSIRSSVDNLILQHRLFEVLRISTIIYGILSIILFYYILKKYISKKPLIGTLFFSLSPLFFVLSNYFKYDPAVMFWIILSIYAIFKYKSKQTLRNLTFAGIVSALAASIKISALPLFPIFFLSFFIFTHNSFRKIKNLFLSACVLFITFLIFGIPDLVFKTSAYQFYLSENLIRIPHAVYNLNLNQSWPVYLLLKEYPSIFGWFTVSLFYISILFLLIQILRKKANKNEIFVLFLVLFFALSLIPLKITAGGSRSLVLLPIIALTISLLVDKINIVKFKKYLIIILISGFLLQSIQIASWIYLKWQIDPQESSSKWIIGNIKRGTEIGLENIPIYQNIPDIALKEFYQKQYDKHGDFLYSYKIIYPTDKKFPKSIIITNKEIQGYFKTSPTKDLLNELNIRRYKAVKSWKLDFSLYNIFNDKGYLIFANMVQVPSDIILYQK